MGISREQALDCLHSDDLIGIGMEADAVRRRLHPEGVVSYAIGRRICCGGLGGATDATVEKICGEVRETVEMGASGVQLVGWGGGGSKAYGLAEIEQLVRGVRVRFPSVWVEGFSAAELVAIARECGLGLRETIARLRDAGLDSIAGDGIALDEKAARFGCGPEDWIEVHRAAHGVGMRTVAAITFFASDEGEAGAVAAMGRLVDRLESVRRLQEETGGFAAFVPRSFQPEGGGSGYGVDEPTAVEYLKVLAVSRMVLDNIENVEASGSGRGLKVLQMGLRFGANDAGWLMAEGHAAIDTGEEDLRRVIRDAGFRPVERDAPYQMMLLS